MSATQKHLDSKLQEGRSWPVRYRLICADGFSVSVQASKFHYSRPRDNNGTYQAVELGFPTSNPGPAIMEYAESPGDDGGIFAFVPIELVDVLIATHGGIAE